MELTPGTRPPDGKVQLDRRKHPCHYLPAGAGAADGEWLGQLLEHAEQIVRGAYTRRRFDGEPREEAFVGVAPRTRREGGKHAVDHTRWLWVDVDKPGELPALWALLAERPCHLLIESAGSGGMHAYWKLEHELPAVQVDDRTGEAVEWIERANLRLIHRLGIGPDGNPSVADRQCAERSRVMRLAGTVNWKTGRYARIVQADLALAPYPIAQLVGDLPEPAPPRPVRPATRPIRPRCGRSRRPVQADRPAGLLRGAGGRRGPAVRAGALPLPHASRPGPVLRRRAGRLAGLVLPLLRRRAARSTTWHRCCSAARPARRCAARSSSAREPTSATRSES